MTKENNNPEASPGVCLPWEEITKEYGSVIGDENLLRKQWEEIDKFAYLYLWWWVQR